MSTATVIRNARNTDAKAIANIYNHYILSSVVTFDEEVQTERDWMVKIQAIQERFPFLVMEINKKVVGYAYATSWKTRNAYRYTCESSIYLDPSQHRKGLGKPLYQALFIELKKQGYKLVLAGISLPNPQSVNFHENLDFTFHGTLKNVGLKFNNWIDVGYWGLRLD